MFRDIFQLYSSAAYEFPESSQKWLPKWFTKHKSFQQIKGDRIFKIFSQFGLNDFRENFENTSAVENLKDRIISNLSDIVQEVSTDIAAIKSDQPDEQRRKYMLLQLNQVAYKLIHEMMKNITWTSDKHRITTQVSSEDKRFRIDSGTSVIKAYNIVKIFAAKLGTSLPNIESSVEFKDYSKRGGFSIVFSTMPEDIAAMSSRSEWGSCMSFDSTKGLNACLLGSTLSKFIGIIYITTGKSYEERGEEMIARCLIRFAIDTEDKKPAIIIDKMYPGFNIQFSNAIKSAIQKRTSIKVYDINELSTNKDFARFKIPEEKISGVLTHEKSYLDIPEVFKEPPANVIKPVEFTRKYINELSKWLAVKSSLFIKKFITIDTDQALRDSIPLTRSIIVELLKPVAISVAQHYRSGGKPMSESHIRKMFYDEMAKPIQQLKIRRIIREFEYNIQERGINYLSDPELKKDLSGYIFYQLINLPEF